MYSYPHTLAIAVNRFRPALALERALPRIALTRIRALLFVLLIGSGGFVIVTSTLMPDWYHERVLGLTLVLFGLWLEQFLLYCYHNSYYFRGLDSIIASTGKPQSAITYDVASVLAHEPHDITAAFFHSTFGSHIALRANLNLNEVETWLQSSRARFSIDSIRPFPDKTMSVITLTELLIKSDSALVAFLQEQAVTPEHFMGASRFVMNAHHASKRHERWWSRDNLSRRGGIGRDLSYGTPYELERFARNLYTSAIFSDLTSESSSLSEYIIRVEQVLARSKSSNVLLIGNAGVGKIDILIAVQRRLERGQALNALSGQQLIILDTERLLANYPDKGALEAELLTILNQAANAGNISIVIENMSHFIEQAAHVGVAIPELFDEYLALPSLHIIGTDTPGAYHTYLAPRGAFTRRFEEIIIEATDTIGTLTMLQSIALQQERKYDTIFTYQALETIVEAADRYIAEGVMPDKAITLLIETAEYAKTTGTALISSDTVYSYVSTKTGIPAGPIQDAERDRLLQLEDIMHARIIGQDRAVSAVARTMRRARVDIERSDKPIGSFLFLGPTGVGKTETAKALAHTFFGNEEAMVRFDMSEFSSDDALNRLIGDGDTPGLLASELREHPYTVLLLDEFEKAHRSVHDLFLQILDEGRFNDARGEVVNARNTIIIATSNAGADLIIKTTAARQELATLERAIIDHIITIGLLRPELINRFDGAIVFESLSQTEQGQIAGLMLRDLATRIKSRGYTLELSPDVIELLTEHGYDPQFGARPMQRIIQDLVEETIAQRIIAGTVQKGDVLHITRADLEPLMSQRA